MNRKLIAIGILLALVASDAAIYGREVIAIAIMFTIYGLPSLVASLRNHRQKGAIAAVNLLLGWTFIGWAVAMIWAFTNDLEGSDVLEVLRTSRNPDIR